MDPRSDKPFYFAPLNPKLAQTRYTAAKAMLADQVRGMLLKGHHAMTPMLPLRR